MSETLGALISLGVLVAGVLLGLERVDVLPWANGLSLVLVVGGTLGLMYFLVVGAGRHREARHRGRSS